MPHATDADRFAASARARTEVGLLADRIAAAQGLDHERAEELAQKIAFSSDDIWDAVMSWARTGEMPTVPEIRGHTPRDLARRLRPSQVFTALTALRSDPVAATNALRYLPTDLPRVRG